MMFSPDENGVYAKISASKLRRGLAYGVLIVFGGALLLTGFTRPLAFPWLVMLVIMGGGALWLAERLRRTSHISILLTDQDVRDSTGRVLTRIDNIIGVDRAAFSFRPSNGFTLMLKSRQPRGWAPGIWWSMGRRVGIGGITPAGEAKFMAEQIAFRIESAKN